MLKWVLIRVGISVWIRVMLRLVSMVLLSRLGRFWLFRCRVLVVLISSRVRVIECYLLMWWVMFRLKNMLRLRVSIGRVVSSEMVLKLSVILLCMVFSSGLMVVMEGCRLRLIRMMVVIS